MSAPRIKQPKRTLYMWGKANIYSIKSKCNSLYDAIIDVVPATANIDEVWSLFKNGEQLIINNELALRQSDTQLIVTINNLAKGIDKGVQIDAILCSDSAIPKSLAVGLNP